MHPIERMLTLWHIGLLSSDAVAAWADDQILQASQPAHELIELSLHGPEACLKRPSYEFPVRPRVLPFHEMFSVMALRLDTSSDEETLQFAKWVACNAMGEDLAEPFVMFGYRLDDLLDDRADHLAAVRLVRDELPWMLSRCESLALPLLGVVPNNPFRPEPLRGSA